MFCVFAFYIVLLILVAQILVKMKNMLWIEDIVESTLALSFLTNFRVDMVGFVNLHKVVVRSAFLAFSSA